AAADVPTSRSVGYGVIDGPDDFRKPTHGQTSRRVRGHAAAARGADEMKRAPDVESAARQRGRANLAVRVVEVLAGGRGFRIPVTREPQADRTSEDARD